jgi:YidC/Oxa1 family membrane protein insertase
MNLPGLAFIRERNAMRAFETQDRSFRDLVFYSEGAGDWPHLGPVISVLLRDHERSISYLTSDAEDPGLSVNHPRFRSFQVGAGTVRTILFARLDVRHFVMTMPDLGSLWLKRSVHQVHYVYLFHSLNSTHTAYRKGAFDAYDTIMCAGPHHVDEIRRTEAVYGLPAKELVQHGSVKLDSVLADFAGTEEVATNNPNPNVLVAPSWGDCSLIERPVGIRLLEALLSAGFPAVLRLHPMTVRRHPAMISGLKEHFAGVRNLRLEDDMNATASWLSADVMVSDWSGAATEYAFALRRPVLFVDTPPKRMNPEWEAIGLPAFEEQMRGQIGAVISEDDIELAPQHVASLLLASSAGETSKRLRAKLVYNVGHSAIAAADYLASAP